MDDKNESFRKVILRNEDGKKNVFKIDIETGKELPFYLTVKDENDKTVFSKNYRSSKILKDSIDLSKEKKGSYTMFLKQGKETISNHSLTIE